jgi:hypothetical protein
MIGLADLLDIVLHHQASAGRTFSYGANGPQGLLKGKHGISNLACEDSVAATTERIELLLQVEERALFSNVPPLKTKR